MRLPDFIINLFLRVTPMHKDDLASLKSSFGAWYTTQLDNMENKENKLKKLNAEISDQSKTLDNLDEHSPDYEKELIKFHKLEQQEIDLEKPNFLEKSVEFFEKPLVRVCLMAVFSALSWWIMRKITSTPKEEEKEEMEEKPQNYNDFQNQNYYNMPPPPPIWDTYQNRWITQPQRRN